MVSPFRKHQQKVLAAQAARAAGEVSATVAAPNEPDEASEAGQEYAALRVQLHEHLRLLKDTESHEARQPMKAQFAAVYSDWIEGIVEADEPVQDEILITNMIWAIDYQDFEFALKLGAFAVKHGLAMPEGYKRSVANALREDIAEVSLKNPDAVPLEVLTWLDQLTASADMHDNAKAKLNKALGKSWLVKAQNFDASEDNAPAGGAAAYAEQSLANFKRAKELNPKAGVVKDIQAVEKLLRDLQTAADE